MYSAPEYLQNTAVLSGYIRIQRYICKDTSRYTGCIRDAFTGSRAAAQALLTARARPERVLQLSRVKSTRPNPFGDIGMAVSRSCVILLLMLSSASALCASAHSRSFASCDAFRVASDLPDAISTDTLLRQIGKSGGGVKVIGHSAEFSSLSRSSGEGGALAALLAHAHDAIRLWSLRSARRLREGGERRSPA